MIYPNPCAQLPLHHATAQELQAFEANLVAKTGNVVTAIFFTKKFEQIPKLLTSLFEYAQAGGRMKSEIFYDFSKPFPLSQTGICVKIQTQVPDSRGRFILAEVKLFCPERIELTTWFSTARRIEHFLSSYTFTELEDLPWVNTATSFAELYEDAIKISPIFQKMCNDAASQADCVVNFESEEKALASRKVELLREKSTIRNEMASKPSKSTILKVCGAVIGFFSLMYIDKSEFLINQNQLTQNCIPTPPCICPSINDSYAQKKTNDVVAINTGQTNNTEPNASSTCQIRTSSGYIEIVSGPCNEQEIRSASEELRELSDAAEKEKTERNKIYVEEALRIKREEIAASKAKNKAWLEDWEEKIRKNSNPTPQELKELYAEIDCELDKRFRGWPGYLSTCPTNTEDPKDDCRALKSQFNRLALLYHSDKNKSPEAEDKFNAARIAYETLCPRPPQDFVDEDSA